MSLLGFKLQWSGVLGHECLGHVALVSLPVFEDFSSHDFPVCDVLAPEELLELGLLEEGVPEEIGEANPALDSQLGSDHLEQLGEDEEGGSALPIVEDF